MPFNGSGLFVLPSPEYPALPSTIIYASTRNTIDSDIAAGLSNTICKDGQTTVTANIPFNGFKLTNVGTPTVRSDAANLGTVQDGMPPLTTTGSGTAYQIAPVPPIPSYVAGYSVVVQFHTACGENPTLQISGLASPPNLVKRLADGTLANLEAGDIPSNWRSRVVLLSATQALIENLPRQDLNNTRLHGSLRRDWLTTGGSGTAYTLAPTDALAAYAAGHSYLVQFHTACGENPTLQISGLASPPNLVKRLADGTLANLEAGDIPSNWRSRVVLLSATQALVEQMPLTLTASDIPTPALGSGTANSTTFLRGDRTWATISVSGYRLSNIVRYTTPGSGTYNKPANVIALLIRAIGAGGGGRGGGENNFGGGGGSGGYGELFVTTPAASYNYTVGAGGVGGGNDTNGSAGSATTIAGISAGGGSGGTLIGGSGGTTSGADINVRGSDGVSGVSGGSGGSGVFGGGGGRGSDGNGNNGVFGGGGGGGANNRVGGSGGAGYIEIWEFI